MAEVDRSGLTPLRIARAIAASVQVPIPVSRSGVMFRTHKVPKGRQLTFRPPLPSGLWQKAHEATLNRYCPRAVIARSSEVNDEESGVGIPAVAP